MARFLFAVWSIPGHINPTIAVAEALRARGHEVAFFTGSRAAMMLQKRDFTHHILHSIDEEVFYARLFPPSDDAGRTASLAKVQRLRATLRYWLVDTIPLQHKDLEPLLERWHPDVVVSDPTMWAPPMLLRDSGRVPVAIFNWGAAAFFGGRDAPPWGRGLPPPTTPLRRLRVEAESMLGRLIFRDEVRAVNALRTQYGLRPLSGPLGQRVGETPLYIVASAPELDYGRRDLPPSVHYVGYCSPDMEVTQKRPDWLEALPSDLPFVYVTEGTVQGSQPTLLQAAARGLANERLFALLKDAQALDVERDPAKVGLANLSPNMRLEGYVAGQGWQTEVLARASVIITNGGAGSVLTALAAGVPLIVVPTAWDKPDNAQRVVEAGAGLRLNHHTLTAEKLRTAVLHVLRDPIFATNARRIAAALKRAGGPARAAELLEEYAYRCSTSGTADIV